MSIKSYFPIKFHQQDTIDSHGCFTFQKLPNKKKKKKVICICIGFVVNMIYEQHFSIVITPVLNDQAPFPCGLFMCYAVMRNLADLISLVHLVPTMSWGSCSALFTADSVIILVRTVLSYHIVVLSEPFPLCLCFLAGLFFPY